VKNRVEIYVAEVEVLHKKFLNLEDEKRVRTRIEGKISRFEKLVEDVKQGCKSEGVKEACIAKIILICFD